MKDKIMIAKATKKRTPTYEIDNTTPEPNLHHGYYHVLNAENGKGKTYYLNLMSKYILRTLNLEDLKGGNLNSSNLICLSGTPFDKFDRYATFKKYLTNNKRENYFYYYTGYTKNNNSFSPQIPFRTLFEVLAIFLNKNPSTDFNNKVQFLSEKLSELKFENYFKVILQKAEKSVGKKERETCVKVSLDNSDDIIKLLKDIKGDGASINNNLEIQDIEFYRRDKNKIGKNSVTIFNLSSGEYAFLRALFTLCLSINDNSYIIYDEPENSLHPEWQSRLIKYIIEIIDKFGKNATVLIATHSPLITASFSVENIKISEYSSDNNFKFQWVDYKYYGWSANLILTEQFDLYSARPTNFIEQFNLILQAYQENRWDDLDKAIKDLDNHKNFHLSERDNLSLTYEAIKKELLNHKKENSND